MSKLYQCEGKEAFDDATMANRVARKARKRRSGARLQVYKCTYCHKWHLGNSPPGAAK